MPLANFNKQKCFYFKKHEAYSMKTKVSVQPNGLATHIGTPCPGAKSNITMFQENIEEHSARVSKTANNPRDNGELSEQYPNCWGILANAGYVGAEYNLRVITPHKQVAGLLTTMQLNHNRHLAHDRVIVENFFGRMKQLWGMTSQVYQFQQEDYEVYIT